MAKQHVAFEEPGDLHIVYLSIPSSKELPVNLQDLVFIFVINQCVVLPASFSLAKVCSRIGLVLMSKVGLLTCRNIMRNPNGQNSLKIGFIASCRFSSAAAVKIIWRDYLFSTGILWSPP